MANLPHYLLNIDDSGELGIEETSFVEYPATGLSFLAFEEEKVEHTFAKLNENGYQQLVSGVLMMPSTKYLRSTKEGEFYTVEFTAETLKKAMIDYLKKDNQNNVKVEHKGANLEGFKAIEHWIIEDENTKSPILGLSLEDLGYDPTTIPQGTIMKTTYVADEKFFNEKILAGKVQGYSIGGLFELEEVEAKTEEFRLTTDVPTVADVLRAIGISGKEVNVTSKEGIELSFGELVKDGDNLANDTYEFGNNLVVVIKDGVIVDYGFQESYSDYPKAAKDNAKRAIKANEENDNKCATQTGKVRAQQIASGEALSLQTVKRTFSYLSRAKEYDSNDWETCGTISYNLWGGDEMLNWAERILNAKEETFNNETNTMETTTTETAPAVEATETVTPTDTVETQEEVTATEPTAQVEETTEAETITPQVNTAPEADDKLASTLAEYDAKIAELVSKLGDIQGRMEKLTGENEAKEAQISELKDKLKKEPIKRTNALREMGNKTEATNKARTLKIGNKTINI